MPKTVNHHVKKWILRLLIALVIIFLIVMLMPGCSEAKKDQKAINRVNANINLQEPVVNQWLKAHPQDTTTHIIVSEPKIIQVPVIKLVKDTSGTKKSLDSLLATIPKDTIHKDCGEAANKAYDLGYDVAEKYYLSHPIKATCPPDTTKEKVFTSTIDRLNDSLIGKNLQIAAQKGTMDEVRTNLSDAKKTANKREWYIWVIIAVAILSHVARTYLGGWISSIGSIFNKK